MRDETQGLHCTPHPAGAEDLQQGRRRMGACVFSGTTGSGSDGAVSEPKLEDGNATPLLAGIPCLAIVVASLVAWWPL